MYMQGLHYDLDTLFPGKPDFLEIEDHDHKDYDYFIHLYPMKYRSMVMFVEEYLDSFEYEGSPLFHEYPDAVRIYRMTKDIYDNMCSLQEHEYGEDILDILEVLVCQSIYVRRRRHALFCKDSFMF